MRRSITYDPQRDYYAALGLDDHAAPETIRRAYRQAVLAAHPDRNPDRVEWATERLMLLNEAYDVLSDPELRRRYDRERWPHVPFTVRPASTSTYEGDTAPSYRPTHRYRSPFSQPNYQPDRPWWEQVQRAAPTGYPFADEAPPAAPPGPPPIWLVVAEWLKQRGLGWLEPAWLALVGIWRSPYGGMILVLAVALAVNLTFLAYALLTPGANANLWGDLRGWWSPGSNVTKATALPPTPAPTATRDHLHVRCNDPNVQITQPAHNDVVNESFSVYGTVQPPDLWQYALMIGYLGPSFDRTALPDRWITVRRPPSGQNIAEPPISAGPLTTALVTLDRQQAGYWAVRLIVTLRDGSQLRPCDVVIRYE